MYIMAWILILFNKHLYQTSVQLCPHDMQATNITLRIMFLLIIHAHLFVLTLNLFTLIMRYFVFIFVLIYYVSRL